MKKKIYNDMRTILGLYGSPELMQRLRMGSEFAAICTLLIMVCTPPLERLCINGIVSIRHFIEEQSAISTSSNSIQKNDLKDDLKDGTNAARTIGEIISHFSIPTGQNLLLRKDKNPPVYTGPGGYYYRANSERAQVFKDREVTVYACDGDWVLIEYNIANDLLQQNRIGYISLENLSLVDSYGEEAQLEKLITANELVVIKNDTELTDDPACTKSKLIELKKGVSVKLLCRYKDTAYAYVEVDEDCNSKNQMMRGFVLIRNLEERWKNGPDDLQ